MMNDEILYDVKCPECNKYTNVKTLKSVGEFNFRCSHCGAENVIPNIDAFKRNPKKRISVNEGEYEGAVGYVKQYRTDDTVTIELDKDDIGYKPEWGDEITVNNNSVAEFILRPRRRHWLRNPSQFEEMYAQERREHPSFSDAEIKQIVRDHMGMNSKQNPGRLGNYHIEFYRRGKDEHYFDHMENFRDLESAKKRFDKVIMQYNLDEWDIELTDDKENLIMEADVEIKKMAGMKHPGSKRNPKGPKGGATQIQSLIFDKKKFTPAKIKTWFKKHPKFKFGKIVEKKNYWHVRQARP